MARGAFQGRSQSPLTFLGGLEQSAGTGPVPAPSGPDMSTPDSTNNVLFPGLNNSPQPPGGITGGPTLNGMQRPEPRQPQPKLGGKYSMRSTL